MSARRALLAVLVWAGLGCAPESGLFALRDEAALVSEVLHERGWRTAAAVGAYVLDPRFGLEQGFDRYG